MQEKKRIQEKEYSDTILARDWKDPKCVRVGGIFDTDESKHQAGSIYDKEGISPTLDVMQGGWRQPSIVEEGLAPTLTQQEEKILVNNATKKGYDEATEGDSINISFPTSKTRRGRVGHQLSQTIQCNDLIATIQNMRIRKLTPKECWRLMGFDNKDFEKAEKVNSNTQLYKQARKLYCCKCFRKNITKFI